MTDFYSQLPAPSTNTGRESRGLSFDGLAIHKYGGQFSGKLISQLSSARSYASLQYLFGVQDPAMLAPKGSRNRRKSAQGSEHVKHRRTRSGCYTCRSRRVKCDENHPICERCKKGGRECIYPEPKSATKANNSSHKAREPPNHGSPNSSTEEYEDDADAERFGTILDGETQDKSQQRGSLSKSGLRRTGTGKSSHHRKSFSRRGSETPSLVQDKGASPSPSTEGSIVFPMHSGVAGSRVRVQLPYTPSGLGSDWSHHPHDVQFYLSYFYKNLTLNHYFWKHDSGDFLRTHYIDAALRNDALLYAVVGFSAFQHTLGNPTGKIQDFLQYYNRAVSLLLKSLTRGERHNTGILLAILQLATIEEYLGDWINLLGHQKAAYEILTELFTPQTVMHEETARMILGWYMRFDVFAGLLGGFATVLSRDWFSGAREYYARRSLQEPDNINWKIEESVASLRLIAMDMSILFARKGKGELAPEQFLVENDKLGRRISDWKDRMDPALQDPLWQVNDFTGAPPLDPDDIVDPYVPGTLYQGPIWSMNKCTIDWYSIDLMHKYQTALALQSQPSKELAVKAYASCQLFEAMEYWPGSPKGITIACQASLGIASLFLPRDRVHSMWCRRKLAAVESLGYIFPLTFREKMSALFRDPSCMHWWLPNNDKYPPIIRSIRNFVEERTSGARDVPEEDLRDMKAVFAFLKLDEGKMGGPLGNAISKSYQGQITMAADQGWQPSGLGEENLINVSSMDMVADDADAFGIDFDAGQGYWGGSQSQGSLRKEDPGYP